MPFPFGERRGVCKLPPIIGCGLIGRRVTEFKLAGEIAARTMVVAGLILSATPAFAAPQWVEDLCWYHANRVLPALDQRERKPTSPTA